MTSQKYPRLIRLLHWLMAIAIFGMIASGWYMAALEASAPNKYSLYPLHKSFGVLVLFLVVLRVVLRLRASLPALPAMLQDWEKRAAHLGHGLLYLLMIAVPASGYVMSGSYAEGHGIDFFGVLLPDLVPKSKSLFEIAHSLHAVLPYLMLALVMVHVAGALKHRWLDRPEVDVLPRIWGLGK